MTTGATTTDDRVAAFLAALAARGETVPPEPRPALVTRLDGSTPLHAVPDPLATPPAPAAHSRRRARRPLAAAFVGGAVLFGGLAAAGALPAPLQRVTADVGARVGIDLPVPDRAEPAPAPRPAGSRPPLASRPGSGAASSGARGSSTPGSTAPTVTPTVPAPPEAVPLPAPLPDLPLPTPKATAPSAPPPGLRATRNDVRRVVRDLSSRLPAP
jgi:hypothetical protein